MTSTECNFRRTPDRLDITPSRALCRQLFGPIDHSQLQEDLTRELTKMDQEATTKWNFDFVNDKPLEGNYLWSRFQHKDSTAKALTNSVRCRTEKSNNSLDAVTTVENEERPTHTNTDISNETSSKPELIFSDNEKKLKAKCSTKKKSSSRKITGNFNLSFLFWC